MKVRGASSESIDDRIAIEEPLEIRVNGEVVAITMRTPGEDARLALGFLFSEGIVGSIDDVGTIAPCGRPGDDGYGNAIEVTPSPGVHFELEKVAASRRGTLTTAACGVCGRRSVDDLLALTGTVGDSRPLPIATVPGAFAQLSTIQQNFRETGGVHAAAAISHDGNLIHGFEDVGRHNAVDKVIGALIQDRRVSSPMLRGARRPSDTDVALLVVSGRASFEIIQKAAMARIPVVASVSAASSLAIELADRANVALVGFVREGAMNVYTHRERLSGLS
ncbi:MAG: formate dehydrogenase accessory sulfurtransferase FdhD [Myxococcaceae bacterium]